MSQHDLHKRWEELTAGRVLGDLSPEEWKELSDLEARFNDSEIPGWKDSFDFTAAAVDAAYLSDSDDPTHLPPSLEAKLKETITPFVKVVKTAKTVNAENTVETQSSEKPTAAAEAPTGKKARPRRFGFSQLALAWTLAGAMAALALALFLSPRGSGSDPVPSPSPAEQLASLKASDEALAEQAFTGPKDSPYAAASGRAYWSSETQQGFMELSDLPVNDPAEAQYQLWIVDPERDEKPVDGGVFDIADAKALSVIPIDAKLRVNNPTAFVITLEKPGGVVVSAQKTVVAVPL